MALLLFYRTSHRPGQEPGDPLIRVTPHRKWCGSKIELLGQQEPIVQSQYSTLKGFKALTEVSLTGGYKSENASNPLRLLKIDPTRQRFTYEFRRVQERTRRD
jgi:hypothetical protein